MVSEIFSRGGSNFHGRKTENFHERIFFSSRVKKTPHYNNASRAQLSKPFLFQGRLRDRMQAVICSRTELSNLEKKEALPSPPAIISEEVVRISISVPLSDVHKMQDFSILQEHYL